MSEEVKKSTLDETVKFGLDSTKKLFHIALSLRMHAMFTAMLLIYYLAAHINNPEKLAKGDGTVSLLLILVLAGSLGGVINNYFRLSKLRKNSNPYDLNFKERFINIVQIYATLFISGALGIIFYTLLASGIIQGELFPAFTNLELEYGGDMIHFFKEVTPQNNIDVIKAIAWCFIAGFSEMLVPNSIDKLAQKVNNTTVDKE